MSHLQPVQSGHFPTDVIQLCQGVIQQNPFNQRQKETVSHISSLCSKTFALSWEIMAAASNNLKKASDERKIGNVECKKGKTYSKTREFSPENVMADI